MKIKDHIRTVLIAGLFGLLTGPQAQVLGGQKNSSESEDFLENDGIINFLREDRKPHFEINLSAGKQNDLRISSQLLKLAERVVDE